MSDERDPRFLDGAGPGEMILTDSRSMALVVCIGFDGTADISCQIGKKQAAAWLRVIADQWDLS